MVDRTTIKPRGFICDLNRYIHGILYIITLKVLQNNVININYSMLLGKAWLRDAKVAHDWGNNIVTIQRNGMIKTIVVVKHLRTKVKRPEMLLC